MAAILFNLQVLVLSGVIDQTAQCKAAYLMAIIMSLHGAVLLCFALLQLVAAIQCLQGVALLCVAD